MLVPDFFVWLKMSEKKKVDVILLVPLLFLRQPYRFLNEFFKFFKMN